MGVKRDSIPDQPRRRRNAAATREAILHSALIAFSRHGYDGVGVREIATRAGVTAVLVNRYFGSKEELFAAAVEVAFADSTLFEGECAGFANRLTTEIMTKSDPHGAPSDALLLLLRSAPNPRAAEILRDSIGRHFETPLKSLVHGRRAGERAAVILAVLIGLQLMRKVIGSEALSEASGSLSEELRTVFQRLIDGAASGKAPRRRDSGTPKVRRRRRAKADEARLKPRGY
jgi:AcrR family transcriptional regulator